MLFKLKQKFPYQRQLAYGLYLDHQVELELILEQQKKEQSP